jgi:3-hydroxybutyrate dehydrogenase
MTDVLADRVAIVTASWRGMGRGKRGATCNAICPGAVETDTFVENGGKYAAQMGFAYDDFKDLYAKESAIGRRNTIDEVAALAVLLASEVGGGINGAMINVDGGSVPY